MMNDKKQNSELDLKTEIERRRLFGEAVCQKLRLAIDDLGFEKVDAYPDYQAAEFQLVKEAYTGNFNILAVWYDAKRQRIGQLQFQSDGSCYAEYDVVKAHPRKKKWFVESVTAWGRLDNLKAEAKLLEMPE